jgi:hypothetical protein
MPFCQRGHALLAGELECPECGSRRRSDVPEASHPPYQGEKSSQSQIAWAVVAAGSLIGLIMSMQSASIMTGTGTLWTGVALSAGAALAAIIMRNLIPTAVVVAAVVVAAFAFSNARSTEGVLQERQQQIQTDLNDLGTGLP